MPAKKTTKKVVAKAQARKAPANKSASVKKATPKEEKKSAKVVAAPKESAVNAKSVENAKKALVAAKKEKVAKDAPAIVATGPMAQKWTALFKKSESIESKPYNMKASYVEKTAIVHKVLGWGYILANRNDRLVVLFKDGIKYLISNYK